MVTATPASASVAQCRALFNPERNVVRHREEIAGTPIHEKLDEREIDLLISLKSAAHLDVKDLYERYSRLERYSSVQRALGVSRASIIRLAAASLKAKVPLERATDTIDMILMKAGRNNGEIERPEMGRLKLPHRIVFSLAELTLLTGAYAGDVADHFNENLSIARTQPIDPGAVLQENVFDVALKATLAELNTP